MEDNIFDSFDYNDSKEFQNKLNLFNLLGEKFPKELNILSEFKETEEL